MSYFVTGGTGFIGRFLIDKLIRREGTIFVLVRKDSVKKLDALRPRWGADAKRVVAIVMAGDKGGSQFPNELRFLGGRRTPIEGLGDEAYLVERSGEHIVIVRRRHAAMLVHLASRLYDREAALRIAEHTKSKVSLLEPYADTWKRKHGSD